jgi:transketolase
MKKLRNVFAETMLEIGQSDPQLVVMVGDISHGILQPFAKACPGRYFNIGICEPAMVNMAAGLSKCGLIPVVHTIAPFIIERAYEQIKLDFGYQNLGINLISVGGAFDYSQLGCSHHCYTDISLISHFKRGRVMCPGSPVEFTTLFKAMYRNGDINYFRLPEYPHGIEFRPDQIKPGEGVKVREGSDVTILCIGTQLKTAVQAAHLLSARNVQAEIIYLHTIKPFDNIAVRSSVEKTRRLLCIEEASAHDGVFNLALRATLGLNDVKYSQVAIDDFVHGYGTYEELCEKLDFTPEGIVRRVIESFPALRL